MKILPLLAASLLVLAACGGGGGGSSGSGGGAGGSNSTGGSPGTATGVSGGSSGGAATGESGAGSGSSAGGAVATGSGGTGASTGAGGGSGGLVLAPPTGPRTLVLYDAPAGSEWQKLGFSYAIMLRNLLGHFDAQVDLLPVQQYTAGQIDAHQATFYLGAAYETKLPAAFLADAAVTSKTLVWFKYNLWQLAGDPAYNFAQTRGFTFDSLRGMNAVPTAAAPAPGFFDTVTYKNRQFVKYYAYDSARNQVNADPEVGITSIVDPARASALVKISNPATGEQAPYVLRSGNFWYVADMPFSYIGPRDRYLVLADLLHDMVDVQHAESHKALVRLEDVDAKVSVAAMKNITDALATRHVPFSIAVIPRYVDAFGAANDGKPQDIPLAAATRLKQALDYALPRGAEIVMHGYTHQYSPIRNPWSGVSGDDYEFWNIVKNTPVDEDSTAWTLGRLSAGLADLAANGYRAVAWETPHYHASPTASRAFPQLFNTTYQRVVYYTSDQPDLGSHPGKDFAAGQIFPYVIQRDYYNQRVLPESLGNIEYDISKVDPSSYFTYSWQEIYLNAQYALTVRDGFASFFFHPFWAEGDVGTPGLADFKKLVDGITQLGFTWVAPSSVQ
ncbi:MAG: hypothetical protein JWP41_1874 [Ramlibacter sp.]|nr:hypothetical protein [Ramlibacter sp.]